MKVKHEKHVVPQTKNTKGVKSKPSKKKVSKPKKSSKSQAQKPKPKPEQNEPENLTRIEEEKNGSIEEGSPVTGTQSNLKAQESSVNQESVEVEDDSIEGNILHPTNIISALHEAKTPRQNPDDLVAKMMAEESEEKKQKQKKKELVKVEENDNNDLRETEQTQESRATEKSKKPKKKPKKSKGDKSSK